MKLQKVSYLKDQLPKTYLGQVRFLRNFSLEALKHLSLKPQKIEFIHHGENATFKVKLKNKDYLLRIHRNDYNSFEGIKEEIEFLHLLKMQNGFLYPVPEFSKKKCFVHNIIYTNNKYQAQRNFVLFKWNEGTFYFKNLNKEKLYLLGQATAQLHCITKSAKPKNRFILNREGLIGKKSILGNFENLKCLKKNELNYLKKIKKQVFKKIPDLKYKNSGFIHSDLHHGNYFFNKNKLVIIDFDDCAYGLYMWDLAITLAALVNHKNYEVLRQELLNGYRDILGINSIDESLISHLIKVRRLQILGWLSERQDNPRIKKITNKYKNYLIKCLKSKNG